MTLNTDSNMGAMENPTNNVASDDVEYIQTEAESLQTEMPKAQMLHGPKEQMRVSKFTGNHNSDARKRVNEHKQVQSQRHSTEFLEDFSDYSMHNVRHLVDPMKVKDSFLKYSQNKSNLELKKILTPVQSARNDQKYDSYGNIIEKSQSLLDASQGSKSLPYGINTQTNFQPSKRPYLSPSIQKTYIPTSSEQPATQAPNVKVYTTSASKSGLTHYSTTQKAYVAPKKLKSAQNNERNHNFAKTSTESIQQPIYSAQQFTDVNHEQIHQYQPQQVIYHQQANYNLPLKQPHQHHESNQNHETKQYQSYSIRNPLTTSIPVQHNNFKKQKRQESPKRQSYIAVPLEANTKSLP